MDSLEQVIEDLSFFRDLMIDKDYKIRLRFEEYRFKLKQYYGLKLAFGLSFRDENITEPYMFRNFTDTTF